MNFKIKSFRLIIIVLGAITFSALSAGQQTPATASAGLLPAQRQFNRLIIKFKDEAITRSGMFDFNAASSQLRGLENSVAMKRVNSRASRLSYLKSITAQTHVALTDQKLSHAELFALARQLEQDPQVAYADIDTILQTQLTPGDLDYQGKQWHYQAPSAYPGGANLPAAWDSAAGTGVVVAVIDTGYRPHADLKANLLPGYDFVSEDAPGSFIMANDGDGRDSDASDPGDWQLENSCYQGSPSSNSSWHGTHVAGTIAAVTNNNLGIAGIAFNAKVLPVRVLGVCGGYLSDVVAGMRWAAGLSVPGAPANPNKAKVLNLSLGAQGACSLLEQETIHAVRAAGSVVVTATGNDSALSVGHPANCAGVIAVSAHSKLADSAWYSNLGLETALSAPGGGMGRMEIPSDGSSVYSTLNLGTTVPLADSYKGYNGTSMATPHVAGVAALLASLQPGISPDALRSMLVNSARPHPRDSFCADARYSPYCGAGLLDAGAAVDRLNAGEPNVSISASKDGIQPTGVPITLHAAASASPISGNTRFNYEWTQLAGPAVSLTSPASATVSFVAPTPGERYSFKVQVTDGAGRSAWSQIGVSTNTAPVLGALAVPTVLAGSKLTFTASATDAENQPVLFFASGLPTGATLNAATGMFNWNAAGPAGQYQFTLTPSDGTFSGTPQLVSVVVTEPASLANSGGGGGSMGWLDLLGLLSLAALGGCLGHLPGTQGAHGAHGKKN